MIRRRILVLERNEKIRLTLKNALTKGDFEYHELSNNDQLFRYLNEHPLDAVLINSSQQGSGSRSICTIIRNDPQFRRFPLIILYGKPGKLSRYDFLNQGADDFVPMPFSPSQLVDVLNARLRLLGDAAIQQSASVDNAFKKIKSNFVVSPLEKKGSLDKTPPAAVFAKLFAHKESGVLDLIINKETRTLFFKNGDLILAETMSKKDDIAEYLSKNRAGSGSGKEILAARIQAGGPKSNLNIFSDLLQQSKLLSSEDFHWWLQVHQIDMIADLFIKPQGVYQWQSLEIPEYTKNTNLSPFSTPRLIFEGVRRVKKWWAYRDLLPENTSIPHLSPDFSFKARDYGLTEHETALMQIVDGKRTLHTIGEMCHIVFPQIENYIYACRQLQMLAFDLDIPDKADETISLHDQIDISDESEPDHDLNAGMTNDESAAHQTPEKEPMNLDKEPIYNVSRSSVTIKTRSEHADNSDAEKCQTTSVSEGLLTDTDVSALFRQCVFNKFTGELVLETPENQKRVFWKRGKIIAAISNNEQERLDNYLLKQNLITEEQQKSLENCPDENTGLLNEVIRQKLLPIDKVFVIVKEYIEEIVTDLLDWTSGSYQLNPDKTPPNDTPPLELSAQSIVINAMHSSDISNLRQNQIPESTYCYRLAGNMENLKGITLTGLERRIINVVADAVKVDKIAQLIDLPEPDILYGIVSLEMAGVIERCEER
jgi:DNA-binding response OmpR family regulator